MHLLWQQRPQNLPCTKHTWQHAGSQSTNQQQSNEHRLLPSLLRHSSYQMNQHSPPPWPGDDDIRWVPHSNSLCTVFENVKPVAKSEVFVIPMMVYNRVWGKRWFKARTPEIDGSHGQLTALHGPHGPQRAKIPEVNDKSARLRWGNENWWASPWYATSWGYHIWWSVSY